MNRLPFELIENILSLLSTKDVCSLSLLNQHWNTIGSMKLYCRPSIQNEKKLILFTKISKKVQSYIRVLDFSSVHPFITNLRLSPLLQNSKNIKHLNLSKCIHLSPSNILELIKSNLRNLDTLILADCTLSMDILGCIGQANHYRLKILNLSNTMIKPCTAIDTCNHLEAMITSPFLSSQLIYLDLSYCSWVNSQTVENIAHGLPRLESIVLQWCNKVKPKSFKILIKNLKHLKSIDLRHIDSIGNSEQIFSMIENATPLKKILFTHKRFMSLGHFERYFETSATFSRVVVLINR
ncbi:hypothetical protein EDC94DRAFT_584369 [Helicostylum pulchrum]|nr:hypothetical protein EDC94DRAFT_584369 [Helicostylum pulchrum]